MNIPWSFLFNVLNLCFGTTTKKTISVDVQLEVKKMMREKYLLKSCSKNWKRAKKGRRGQWTEHLTNDLVDIILTNTRKNCYGQMSKILKIVNTTIHYWRNKRCCERGEEFPFNVEQTRQKFKRCISMCRDAVMKLKTSSGIKHF